MPGGKLIYRRRDKKVFFAYRNIVTPFNSQGPVDYVAGATFELVSPRTLTRNQIMTVLFGGDDRHPRGYYLTRYLNRPSSHGAQDARCPNHALTSAVRDVVISDAGISEITELIYALSYAGNDTIRHILRDLDTAGVNHGLVLCECGHVDREDCTSTLHNGEVLCESCAEDTREDVNGDRYYTDDLYFWESDGEYHTSEEDIDDDDDDDRDCSSLRSWGASTMDLCHDLTFTSSALGDFIMGVELETECSRGSELGDAARDTLDKLNWLRSDYIMLKSDGSLSDNGFEIVTAARTLPDHLSAFGEWTPHSSLRSWDPETCGLHVHIDSRAFSALTLGKFLMFINADANEPLIKSIAGRHPLTNAKARNYCASADQKILDTPAKALKGGHCSRYRMVNLCNLTEDETVRLGVTDTERDCKGDYSTVELRIFRASLKKERLLAQIEFTHASIMFCRAASWKGLTGADFKKWLKVNAGAYHNLARWFGINVPKANPRRAAASVALDECCV